MIIAVPRAESVLAPPAPGPVLRAVGEVVYDWSIEEDVIAWGENAAEVLGVAPVARIATGRTFGGFLDRDHPESRRGAVFGAAESGGPHRYRVEYPFHPGRPGSGPRLWIEDSGRWYPGPDGRPVRAHGVVRVINDRREREERIRALSGQDALTGCLHRSRLLEALDAALRSALAADRLIAFVVAAIDNFDALNEIHGFAAGDRIFAAVADRIRAEAGETASVGCLSDSTLGVMLPDCSDDAMHAAVLRLRSAIRSEVLVVGGGFVAATISSGGVMLPRHERTAEGALAQAREALRLARQKGTGHFVAYAPSTARQAEQRANAALSTELVAALEDRRLSLAFQPVVDIGTREPLFHEALVRIDRPGEAAARDFAAFAERLGLIRLVDRHVLDRALDVLARTGRCISVNVSANTVGDAEWMARLAAGLAAQPGLAGRLIVEITETAMIGNLEEAAAFVGELHDAGCRVAIDDFGAGFSSFRNLRVLDVDIVKIDGTYIENLAASPDDQVFVRALTQLTRSFGLTTIAEWVQDEATVAILRELGVDAIQGKLTGEASADGE